MSVGFKKSLLTGGVVLAATLALAGCSSSIVDWPGPSADAPSKDVSTYLPVHDLPPDRGEAVIPPEERAKIEAQLIAARDKQAPTAKDSAAK